MPSRPGAYINWVPSNNPAYVQQPTVGQSTTGWVEGENPPYEYMNYLFYTLDQWIQWLDSITQNDSIPATSTVLVTTGTTVSGVSQITGLASTANVKAGLAVSGPGIAANTYVTEISGTTATLSRPAAASLVGGNVTFAHAYATGATIQAQLDELDAAASRNRPYDIVIGSGNECDYPTLAAFFADSAVGGNKRIYLLESQTLSGVVSWNKASCHLFGAAGVSLTGSGTGISVAASDFKVQGVRFVNFTTAIQFLAAGTSGRVLFCNFNNCTTEVDDSGATAGKLPVLIGNITE